MARVLRNLAIICAGLCILSAALTVCFVKYDSPAFWIESGIIASVFFGIGTMVCCVLRFYCGDLTKSEPTSPEATTGSSSTDAAGRQLQAPQEQPPPRPDQDQPAGPSRRDEIILDELNKALSLGLKKRPEPRVDEAAV